MSGLPSSLPSSNPEITDPSQTGWAKIGSKMRQQPLVPIGALMTCGALYMAGKYMRRGDQRMAQIMFRWRVGLQGFTLAALLVGGYFYGEVKGARMSKEDMQLKKAKEREALWIAELERVDAEAKAREARAKQIREAIAAQKDGSDGPASNKK